MAEAAPSIRLFQPLDYILGLFWLGAGHMARDSRMKALCPQTASHCHVLWTWAAQTADAVCQELFIHGKHRTTEYSTDWATLKWPSKGCLSFLESYQRSMPQALKYWPFLRDTINWQMN